VAWHVALADEPSPAFVARATALGLRVHVDVEGLLRERHAAQHATVYLLRPDQHVCARWRQAPDDGSFGTRFAGALGRACGLTLHAEVA
jgi:hypothetical protein